MGYSANLVSGTPFTVTDATAVLDALAAGEHSQNSYGGGAGHISWCEPVANYRKGTDRFSEYAALHRLLTDFGFEATVHLGDNQVPAGTHIYGWGGDKIGSSWDFVWDCLALGTTDTVQWIMVGEDGEVWGESICTNEHRQGGVTFQVQS